MKRSISTSDAPEAIGPYSQATTNGDIVFTSGQIPLTPDGELLDDEPIEVQAEQSLDNIKAVLESEGLSMRNILKTTVLLDDIEEYETVNEVYASYFDEEPPARSAFEVANLPAGVGVEIETIATTE